MKAFVVDAYDSFVHTICLYLKSLDLDVEVGRNDEVSGADIIASRADLVVLGPGPGHPLDCGYVELINDLHPRGMPLLGVCLGHQAIGTAFDLSVTRAAHLVHGKSSLIDHDGLGVFTGVPQPLDAVRYHSLIVQEPDEKSPLMVSARSTDDGYVMGLRHCTALVESVQFHPESVYTAAGVDLMRNFVERITASAQATASEAG